MLLFLQGKNLIAVVDLPEIVAISEKNNGIIKAFVILAINTSPPFSFLLIALTLQFQSLPRTS
uniref:Uncharacterized protein n=1 Tax=Oryza meridionalis TaxID=40149 RepID=A0A0E0CBU6_9ORYZ